jgi:hypothetical protein
MEKFCANLGEIKGQKKWTFSRRSTESLANTPCCVLSGCSHFFADWRFGISLAALSRMNSIGTSFEKVLIDGDDIQHAPALHPNSVADHLLGQAVPIDQDDSRMRQLGIIGRAFGELAGGKKDI